MGLAHCSWAFLVLGGLLGLAWVGTGLVASAGCQQRQPVWQLSWGLVCYPFLQMQRLPSWLRTHRLYGQASVQRQ